MCGCYYYVYEKSTHSYLEEVSSTLSLDSFAQGEIYPKEKALLLKRENGVIKPVIRQWGIVGFDKKLIINARNETHKEKRMFSSLERCVIVCNGFFEWKKSKSRSDKIYVQKRQEKLIYLSGLCDENYFVIVTGKAEMAMKKVHGRTPLIMDEQKMQAYLKDHYDPIVDNEELTFSLVEV